MAVELVLESVVQDMTPPRVVFAQPGIVVVVGLADSALMVVELKVVVVVYPQPEHQVVVWPEHQVVWPRPLV